MFKYKSMVCTRKAVHFSSGGKGKKKEEPWKRGFGQREVMVMSLFKLLHGQGLENDSYGVMVETDEGNGWLKGVK